MFPPIYEVCTSDSVLSDLIGSRIYPFGESFTKTKPYMVWQIISGGPFNCLSGVPDSDEYTVQVDIYGATASDVRGVAEAVRDAIESSCYIVSWRGESRDPDTNNYRISFDCDWIVERETVST